MNIIMLYENLFLVVCTFWPELYMAYSAAFIKNKPMHFQFDGQRGGIRRVYLQPYYR